MTPRILGILNVTADSFSDGGRYLEPEAAVTHARELYAQGAHIIDIGPASSHPDSAPVSPEEEIRRLKPILPILAAENIPFSVDSYHSPTQRHAIAAGASCLNDIHGFADKTFYTELAQASCQLIVMHCVQEQGSAQRTHTTVPEVLSSIDRFFESRLTALTRAGVSEARLVLDPGMGFFLGATPEPSLAVLAGLSEMRHRYGFPLLISVSRKSFLRTLTGRTLPDIGAATLTAEIWAALQGVDYIRTHEPAPLRDALRFLEALDNET